jgi:hypothetical protein
MTDTDQTFIDALLKEAPSVDSYQSSSPLLEQLIDNILTEGGPSDEEVEKLKKQMLEEFVDWNEVRIVSPDRLSKYFTNLENGEYKRTALQALLNKIFSRSGSLDYQFLMDFESNDLEDYLTGIMELREATIKRVILRVFKKPVPPITTEHEVILEVAGSSLIPGSEEIKEVFKSYEIEQLESIQLLLDQMVEEDAKSRKDDSISMAEDFNSKTLKKILK